MDWNNTQKNAMRSKAVAFEKPARTALMMPGNKCLCVKEAIRKGTFNKNTSVLWVEKDLWTWQDIEAFLSSNKNIDQEASFNNLYSDFDSTCLNDQGQTIVFFIIL
jgi:hypothetical protein